MRVGVGGGGGASGEPRLVSKMLPATTRPMILLSANGRANLRRAIPSRASGGNRTFFA